MEHETAALRDFNDADVACGSIAPDRYDRDARPMSASPPIAVKHWHRSETPLRASSGHCRRSLIERYGMWAEARRYSALMLAALMIGHHLSISALWWA
jgi:hypothetical protein